MGGVPSAPMDVVYGIQVFTDEIFGQVEGDVVRVVFDEGKYDAWG